MHLLVLDGHGVHAQLLGDEVDAVEAIFHLADLRCLRHAAGGGHGGAEVEGRDAGQLEGEAALGANLGERHGLPLTLDALRLPVGALARHLGKRPTTCEGLVAMFRSQANKRGWSEFTGHLHALQVTGD